jgi:hypothetical protein
MGGCFRSRLRDGAFEGGSMRLSLDWWAVLAAGLVVIMVKAGLLTGIPW